MRRVPDAGLSNGSLAFSLQVRDAAELHGRVTSYNFSYFTSYGLAPSYCPFSPRPNSAQLPNDHLWKETQIALSQFLSAAFIFSDRFCCHSFQSWQRYSTQLLSSRICFIYPSNQRRLITPPTKLRLSSVLATSLLSETVDSYMALVDEARSLLNCLMPSSLTEPVRFPLE